MLREMHPVEGRQLGKPGEGFWRRGDTVTVMLDGGSALALEVMPAEKSVKEPVVFGAAGVAAVANGVLVLSNVRGEAGTTARLMVALPPRAVVSRATVNGVDLSFAARRGDVVELSVRFAGVEFRQLQPVVVWDSAFAGGRISGTFTIPQRVFDQLRARRRAWPIPWTAEDYRTTWLVPERLLLYAPFSEPDDSWEAALLIDGKPVEFRKAYTAVRAVRSTFVGFTADVSLLEGDRPYRFELALPAMKPGQFLGLYFENVEPEYVSSIVPVRR